MKNNILLLLSVFLILPALNAQDFSQLINNNLDNLIKKGELNLQDANWETSSLHISRVSGINHIYYYQTLNGIKVQNTTSSIHVLSDGETLKINTNFIKNCSDKLKGNSTSSLSATEIIQLVVRHFNYSITEPLKIISKEEGKNKKIIFSKGGFSEYNIPVNLVFIKDKNNDLKLTWEVSILEKTLNHWWNIYVDANSGEILKKVDNVYTCSIENNKKGVIKELNFNVKNEIVNLPSCEKCYEVIPMPIESPYYGDRVVIANPINYLSSPNGWHNNNNIEYNVTRGNNINAYIGNEDNFEYQPDGGFSLDFSNYWFNQEFNMENARFENASITNLFYWGNIIHDVLYQYGFDEVSGNFQTYNFNKGGEENDLVNILGQRDLNLCNAQIGISKDGVIPFISINACGSKDGAFDNIVLIHEYIHGLSFRLTGGANTDNCLVEGEQMTEGWSDWYALMMTMSSNDISTKPRGIATYLFNHGENGPGARDFPYTTDMSINPQTYDFIKTNQETHQVGSVWAAILWELTWVLIDEYGFDEDIYSFSGNLEQDAGNIIALAIVTEGMKLQPCSPGFIDGRDAILDAYYTIYGIGNDCLLWDAFAKRGLGIYAFQGSSIDVSDGFESFESIPRFSVFDFQLDNICPNNSLMTGLGGGLPYGGIYSGIGIVDDGNGKTFSFDPSIAGIGIHTITYQVQESSCTEASFDEGSIEVVVDVIAPEINCPENIVMNISTDLNQYSIEDFSFLINYSDNCVNELTLTQNPSSGTLVDVGVHLIEFEVTDDVGNVSNCSLNLIVERAESDQKSVFDFFPNPTTDEVVINSNREIKIAIITIYDINGRLIQTKEYNYFGFEQSVNFKNFSQGMYFLKIMADEFSIIKKILKE